MWLWCCLFHRKRWAVCNVRCVENKTIRVSYNCTCGNFWIKEYPIEYWS